MKLNKAQREAVSTIYGPVACDSVAGSGKTTMLILRIAALLESDAQVNPKNILCLTFSDSAAATMRRKLVELIGIEGYAVEIMTFHAFASMIVKQNQDRLGLVNSEPVSELERITILKEIIDELVPEHPLYRSRGNMYFEVQRLANLFRVMKMESLDPEKIKHYADEYILDLPNREEYIYKRNTKTAKKGDLKQKEIDGEKEKMLTLIGAANLLPVYESLLARKSRYDFEDMILYASMVLAQYEYLKLNYMERYQYLMIDEGQDTNASQFGLARLLMDYWEEPNVFLVGDINQTIYAFQGAETRNWQRFVDAYSPKLIPLTENYRSSAKIIENANNLVVNGEMKQIISQASGENKDFDSVVVNQIYEQELLEDEGVVAQIIELIESGVAPEDIAVLYRKHKHGDYILKALLGKDIPVNIARAENLLEVNLIVQVLQILEMIATLQNNSDVSNVGVWAKFSLSAARMMHFKSFALSMGESFDRGAELALLSNREMGSAGKYIFEQALEIGANYSLVDMVSRVFQRFGYYAYAKKYPGMGVYLLSLQEFVAGETRRAPMTVSEFLGRVSLMRSEGVRVPVIPVVGDRQGVTLSTIHGAKGMEWDNVFVIRCTANNWEKARGNNMQYKFPDTLTGQKEESEVEERRLFYVAITRAKKNLILTSSLKDLGGKDQIQSKFVLEAGISGKDVKGLYSGILEDGFGVITDDAVNIEADKLILEKFLENYMLSVTHLSTYLRCPVEFYYKYVMKFRDVMSADAAMGVVIHDWLRSLYDQAKTNPELPFEIVYEEGWKTLYKNKWRFSDTDFLRKLHEVKTLAKIVEGYYNPSNKVTLHEYSIKGVEIAGVPCKGDLDKLEYEGPDVNIVDYKTGNPVLTKKKASGPTDKDPNGGDNWRQGVFYKLLFKGATWHPWFYKGTRIDIIHPNGTSSIELDISSEDEGIVRRQIKETYESIKQGVFSPGCGECEWCKTLKQQ